MSSNPVPTLDPAGFITGLATKVDKLFLYYFFSKDSQTVLYRGKINSLTKLIQLYGNEPLQIKDQLKQNLTAYLRDFFTDVKVEVDVEDGEGDGIILRLNAMVRDSGAGDADYVSVGWLLATTQSQVRTITDLTNGRVYSPQ